MTSPTLSILLLLIFLFTSCTSSNEIPKVNTINPGLGEYRIAFVSNRDGQSDIYSMKPDGSDVVRITNDDEIDTYPVWSPDRTQLAYASFVEGDFGIERSKIVMINADGTGRRLLFDRPMGELSPSWSPDGSQILYTLRSIFLASVDGKKDEMLLTDARFDILQTPAWSPDGQKIAFVALSDTGDEIRIMDKDGSNVSTLTQGYQPAWSPDGQKIAFYSLAGEQNDIFVINANGSELQQLTFEPANDLAPDWSPDGKYIVFMSDRDGNDEIYRMQADGSNPVRITNNLAEDGFPAWRK